MQRQGTLTVGIAQIAPVFLDREKTIRKIAGYVDQAKGQGCGFVAFGEALAPGYPFWLERTDGARFNSARQKEIHAHYVDQAVSIEDGHLAPICEAAARHRVAVQMGCIERPFERGGHSLYCASVFIDAEGRVRNVHRKLVPTYEERLSWAHGDGHGLRVHPVGPFHVGSLNCWENWMPLPRAALYAQGEDLHVALWPGGMHNTHDTTRFIAKEGRCFAISVCGLMRASDFQEGTPHLDAMRADGAEFLANGGSCLAGPDGEWIIPPLAGEERLMVAPLDSAFVRRERQCLDVVGHYARPDVFQLGVDRRRQRTAHFHDGQPADTGR